MKHAAEYDDYAYCLDVLFRNTPDNTNVRHRRDATDDYLAGLLGASSAGGQG